MTWFRMRRRVAARLRSRETPRATATATVQRLAVLLEAGIPAPRAWELVAEAGDETACAVAAAAPGQSVGDVLRDRPDPWPEVALAWQVSETVGARLAPSLRCFADALRDAQDTRDDVDVALADPVATARMLAWLPLVALALAFALGFDVAQALTQPAGIASAVVGVLLMLAARRWTARLVAKAQPPPGLPGLQADVVAIALSGGVSTDRALAVVAGAGGGDAEASTIEVLDLSTRAGAPAAELLRASATDERRRARTDGRLRAARLSSRLLLPMGVCTLPAFLALGVGPMLLSVLSGALPVFAAP